MKSLLTPIIVVFLAFFLQVIVLGYLQIAGVRVDVLLIVTVYFGFKRGMMMGQQLGFLAGFLQDLLSYKYFGVNMLIKTLVGAAIGQTHRRFFSESFLTVFMIVCVLTFLGGLVELYVKDLFFDLEVNLASLVEYFVDALFLQMLLNGLLSPFVFALLDRLHLDDGREF